MVERLFTDGELMEINQSQKNLPELQNEIVISGLGVALSGYYY